MAYTPELTQTSSAILRRIAWASCQPMTRTLEEIISYAARTFDPAKVCAGCKDKSRCADCMFAGHQA